MKYLHSETVFQVDQDDGIIGKLTKFAAHRINPSNQLAPLHRAFSVFLWNEQGHLLVQRRSAKKITFPLMWANSCCSHPIAECPGEELGVDGVKLAAIRKIEHELGIPAGLVTWMNQVAANFYLVASFNLTTFDSWDEFCTAPRLLKSGASMKVINFSEFLGKRLVLFNASLLVDYILFSRLDAEMIRTIRINENEVADYKFLAIDQISELPVLTPWLKMIVEAGLLSQWFDAFSATENNQAPLFNEILSIN